MGKVSNAIDDAKIAGSYTKSVGQIIVTIGLVILSLGLAWLLVLEKRNAVKLVEVGVDRYTGADFESHMTNRFIPLEYRMDTHERLHEEWDIADAKWKLDTTKKLEAIERELRKHRNDD